MAKADKGVGFDTLYSGWDLGLTRDRYLLPIMGDIHHHHHQQQQHLLTILIQMSPIPSHPSTALIEALFRSFDKVENIRSLAKIYILCDGYDEISAEDEQSKDGTKRGRVSSEAARRYRDHLKVLRSKLNQPPFAPSQSDTTTTNDDDAFGVLPVKMIELPEHQGSALAIRTAFDMGCMTTPFVCVAQHDYFFVSGVPLL